MGTLAKTNTGNFFPTIPSLFDDFMTRDLFDINRWSNGNGSSMPAVNIRETDDSYELEVAAPGMKKKDFNVELDNDKLIISAMSESSNEEKDSDGNYTRREFSYQTFRRSFTLPERMVEGEKISARYTDGILHISIPKTEDARTKPARQIKIA